MTEWANKLSDPKDPLELGFAPRLIADLEGFPAVPTGQSCAYSKGSLSQGNKNTHVRETQVVARRHWRHLTVQVHREPLCVAPIVVAPVPLTQIILQLSGAMRMGIHKVKRYRSYQTQPGTLYLTALNQPAYEINWRNLTPGAVHTLHVFLNNDLLVEMAAVDAGLDAASFELNDGSCVDDPILRQLGYALAREVESPEGGHELYGDTIAQMIAAQLVRKHGSVASLRLERKGKLSSKRMRLLRDYIQAHLRGPIKLDELATVACLSPYHFCRVFKRTVGQSPNQYVIAQRIAKAAHLLRHTRLTVAHIASEVGYQNVGHFTGLFYRHAGSLPAEYATRQLL